MGVVVGALVWWLLHQKHGSSRRAVFEEQRRAMLEGRAVRSGSPWKERILRFFREHAQWAGPHSNSTERTTWLSRMGMALLCLKAPKLYTREVDIHQQPLNTTKIVGWLLLAQCTAEVSQGILKWLVHEFVRRRQALQASTPEALDDTSPASSTICNICQQPRRHPACPVTCGHVFCWSCWQEWLQTHTSCPLCRVECRPQQILPLYGYE